MGKCSVDLEVLEGFDGSVGEGDFFDPAGKLAFTSAAPAGECFLPLGSDGD
jgi:hypothetical protein